MKKKSLKNNDSEQSEEIKKKRLLSFNLDDFRKMIVRQMYFIKCTQCVADFNFEFAVSNNKTNSFAIFFSSKYVNVLIDFPIVTRTHTTTGAFVMPYNFSPSHKLGFDSVSKSANSSSSNSGSPLGSSNTFQKQLLPTKYYYKIKRYSLK